MYIYIYIYLFIHLYDLHGGGWAILAQLKISVHHSIFNIRIGPVVSYLKNQILFLVVNLSLAEISYPLLKLKHWK